MLSSSKPFARVLPLLSFRLLFQSSSKTPYHVARRVGHSVRLSEDPAPALVPTIRREGGETVYLRLVELCAIISIT
jgi:hypothetical protein